MNYLLVAIIYLFLLAVLLSAAFLLVTVFVMLLSLPFGAL